MSMIIIQSMILWLLCTVSFLRKENRLKDKSMISQMIVGIIIAKIDGNILILQSVLWHSVTILSIFSLVAEGIAIIPYLHPADALKFARFAVEEEMDNGMDI